MTLIVSPKAAWLKQLGVVGDWPMAGLPKTLHLDGAAEFKSKALKRGCGQYGVELVYRERTHHGGHIERLIGTRMSKLKSLPGATGGSRKARRSYDPDKRAALTLGELEAWFAQQIVGRYHQDPHRGLKGGTPAGAWALHPAPGLPPGPLKRFRIAFLPAINRTLRRDGIVFEPPRALSYCVEFAEGAAWSGLTFRVAGDGQGFFLCEPFDDINNLRLAFLPRRAYRSLHIGVARLPEASGTGGTGGAAVGHEGPPWAKGGRTGAPRLGQLLVELGLVDPQQLQCALAAQHANRGMPLGGLLIQQGALTPEDLARALAAKAGQSADASR